MEVEAVAEVVEGEVETLELAEQERRRRLRRHHHMRPKQSRPLEGLLL